MSAFWFSIEIIVSKEWINSFDTMLKTSATKQWCLHPIFKDFQKRGIMIFPGKPLINLFVRNSLLSQNSLSCCIFFHLSFFFFLNSLTTANFTSQIPFQLATSFWLFWRFKFHSILLFTLL